MAAASNKLVSKPYSLVSKCFCLFENFSLGPGTFNFRDAFQSTGLLPE